MKKLFIFSIVIFLNCAISFIIDFWEFDFPRDIYKYNSVQDIGTWIQNNISYKKDVYDNWQSPEETLNFKTGDCEDMSILLLAILYRKFNIKGNLLLVSTTNNNDVDHATIQYKGIQYGYNGKIKNHKVLFLIPYDEIPYRIRRDF